MFLVEEGGFGGEEVVVGGAEEGFDEEGVG